MFGRIPLPLHSQTHAPLQQNATEELGDISIDNQISSDSSAKLRILRRLYTSHFLSTWNSRIFEFGAPLFLATIYPNTLLYASLYALLRSLSATFLSSCVGAYVDSANRLQGIRLSIIAQRGAVILGCAVLYALLALRASLDNELVTSGLGVLGWTGFTASAVLACVEKLASIGNTVAVERDWVVVLCDSDRGVVRGALNASLRRIDLFCKLVAPVVVGLLDAVVGTSWAITFVAGLTVLSAVIEYVTIAQVYHAVPELAMKSSTALDSPDSIEGEDHELYELSPAHEEGRKPLANTARRILGPWHSYITSPVFPASLALSLLYLTVLSTGVHWQVYMLTIGYSSLVVSLLRVLAVTSELSATYVGPFLMQRIGPIRSGLWSINWQVLWLISTVVAFSYLGLNDSIDGETVNTARIGGALLTAGIVASRLGLWGFDLSVQYLVQDATPPQTRAAFSCCEVAMQNLFEVLSFLATIVFSRPDQFVYPATISCAAVTVAAACFAAYVRKERGHLVHWDRVRCLHCLGLEGEGKRHDAVSGHEDRHLLSIEHEREAA